MKHWKHEKIGYWVIGAGCLIEKGLKLSPSLPNHSKWFQENFDLAYIFQLLNFGGLMSCGSKDMFKMHPVSCTNTHDVTDLVNREMIGNTNTWISRELTMTFL